VIPLPLLLNRYTAGVALAVALAGAGYAYRGHLIGLGYSRAQTEFQAQQTERLREQSRETSRLIGIVKEAQDAYTHSTADVANFRDRARAAERRVRDQAADVDRRIATASADSLRRYAQASNANFDRCTGHVERFAAEAASCSAAAFALRAGQGSGSE
jgi:GrpB-like predicted nucleotidyltransferase (UPF0157 family)